MDYKARKVQIQIEENIQENRMSTKDEREEENAHTKHQKKNAHNSRGMTSTNTCTKTISCD